YRSLPAWQPRELGMLTLHAPCSWWACPELHRASPSRRPMSGAAASPFCVCTAPLSAPRPGRRLGSPAEGSTYWIVIGGLGSCTPDLAFWVHCTTTCRGVKYFGCCFFP